MAHIEIAHAAIQDLDRLILTHSLPPNTRQRVKASLEPLRAYPRLGAKLSGRWSAYRFLLGPWRWLVLVYIYEAEADRVVVATIQDARASKSPTGSV